LNKKSKCGTTYALWLDEVSRNDECVTPKQDQATKTSTRDYQLSEDESTIIKVFFLKNFDADKC
jgi:hypothetical protein